MRSAPGVEVACCFTTLEHRTFETTDLSQAPPQEAETYTTIPLVNAAKVGSDYKAALAGSTTVP